MEQQEIREPRFTQTYFLEQGKQIGKLHQILNSKVFMSRLRRLSSLCIELVLYVFFTASLCFILILPAASPQNFSIDDHNSLPMIYHNRDLEVLLIYLKILLLLALLPVLFLAVILGRNRKKNHLVRQALSEVKKMKEGFEEALRRV